MGDNDAMANNFLPGCKMCERIAAEARGENPYLIAEFEHSFFVVGDHQYCPGYSLTLLKRHVRELHELPQAELDAVFAEMMKGYRAVEKAYKPWKMNVLSLGNGDEHVHWHIYPRYQSDPNHRRDPFFNSPQFKDHLITPDQAREIAARIRANL
jgi:diadenosine tetraphosphate (Ap4A) HIT family hydrolase